MPEHGALCHLTQFKFDYPMRQKADVWNLVLTPNAYS